uniref:14-3-3 domain-containing protein n=1 Tax=Zooxanthella nutricula TaxID=1333877 RepID=A0A6U6J2V3_9DINO|mmetsp:Transcript_21762/g.64848  ORF Transcript_21762/g.64848 Transcript_21762/m.64848 type:complete len:250 (+) Transcript_21762:106-855(+)
MGDTDSADKRVYFARLAEQTGRYDEMADHMAEAVALRGDGDLSVEERYLLSVAYKNALGSRRAAWRTVRAVQGEGGDEQAQHTKEYGDRLANELQAMCSNIVKICDRLCERTVLPRPPNAEARVFYLKMKADYSRYAVEVSEGEARAEAVAKASRAFQSAHSSARRHLPAAHPFRLAVALNHSVFHHDVLGHSREACVMAEQASQDGLAELHALTGASYRDSALLIQLLRDNWVWWSWRSYCNDGNPKT